MEDYVLVKLSKEVLYIMCKVNKRYVTCITMEYEKKKFDMRLTKAFYGCMHSVILWYEIFKGCLEDLSFKKSTQLMHSKYYDKWKIMYNILVYG